MPSNILSFVNKNECHPDTCQKQNGIQAQTPEEKTMLLQHNGKSTQSSAESQSETSHLAMSGVSYWDSEQKSVYSEEGDDDKNIEWILQMLRSTLIGCSNPTRETTYQIPSDNLSVITGNIIRSQERLALEEGDVYSTFEVGQGSGLASESERPERVSVFRQTYTFTHMGDIPDEMTEENILYPDDYPPLAPHTSTTPYLPPRIAPALFERYDRDIGELFTRSGAVREGIFSERFYALDAGAGQTRRLRRAAQFASVSDVQGENQDLRLQLAEERCARLELAEVVDGMRRGQEPRGGIQLQNTHLDGWNFTLKSTQKKHTTLKKWDCQLGNPCAPLLSNGYEKDPIISRDSKAEIKTKGSVCRGLEASISGYKYKNFHDPYQLIRMISCSIEDSSKEQKYYSLVIAEGLIQAYCCLVFNKPVLALSLSGITSLCI
ncbi:hypothetical protein Tco_1293443 [Tanacetum coccineum]